MKLEDDVPESVMVMILARLPIRSISRFKSVCSQWKLLFESSYFRNLYRSLNKRNLSSPWSYLSIQSKGHVIECFGERWGLAESTGTSLSRLLDHMKEGTRVVDITEGLVLLAEQDRYERDSFLVCNPVLQQWIRIPSPPSVLPGRLWAAALVTHMSDGGDLLGYKVVRFEQENLKRSFQVYSSETGNWSYHEHPVFHGLGNIFCYFESRPINLNGCLHWLCNERRVIVADDFYAKTTQEAQQLCRVIDLPYRSCNNPTCTVSCGSLKLIDSDGRQLRVWRLENHKTDPSSNNHWEMLCNRKKHWELLWNVTIHDVQDLFGSVPLSTPVMMHPFDSEVMYLVSSYTFDFAGKNNYYIISGNMRTKRFQRHEAIDRYHGSPFYQFVLPERIGTIPCPPGCSLVTASHKSNTQADQP
ncbi:unnamed protein product [Microthlaspi erraticum]|uniref:F-box domain-containing protein n=1 Tax=Microthlaspi erraticum TaxID=1685480 RepID=A0A6D2IHL9_9BRAS|nr:unnamed protein product [Microthlaspi erraticum]